MDLCDLESSKAKYLLEDALALLLHCSIHSLYNYGYGAGHHVPTAGCRPIGCTNIYLLDIH